MTLQTVLRAYNFALRGERGWQQREVQRLRILDPAAMPATARGVTALLREYTHRAPQLDHASAISTAMHARAAALYVELATACQRAGVVLRRAKCAACGSPLVALCKGRKTYCTRRCAVRASVQRFRSKQAAAR